MTSPDPLDRLAVGMRAVIRHRVPGGLSDALGTVLDLDADSVTVETRRGHRVIARSDVALAKEVPPPASRRGAPHRALSVDDLQRVMLDGWPPTERAQVGGWILRAAGGFTGRANSVLPVGDPGLPLDAAVALCEAWYAERGLPSQFTIAGPEGFAAPEDPLGALLLARGYEVSPVVDVMTASARSVAAAAAPATGTGAPGVLMGDRLDDRWFAAYQRQRPGAGAAARAVLTGSPEQLFARIEVGGDVVAVARAAFAHAWCGIFAVEVDPSHRRRGLARALTGAVAGEAARRGIRSLYLQVSADNTAAVAAYERLGFGVHHTYVYLSARQDNVS